jgi:endonuclease/exonuclease/phosphatase (EEP) superfamily protein YafD
VVATAYAYPGALLLAVLAFYFIGESWWVTAAGMYAPRVLFAAPLPLLVLGLLIVRRRRLLWTQLASLALVLFPLMGFVLPWPVSPDGNRPTLTVLSANVNSSYAGEEAITAGILALAPDVVLLQEVGDSAKLARMLSSEYPHTHSSAQFVLASRSPILSSTDPERLPYYGRLRSPRFMRYSVDTPLGTIAFYNVHPLSPRGMLRIHRFRAVAHEIRTGKAFEGDAEANARDNAGLRALQIEAVSRLAAAEKDPVVIAGDTNLPGLSAVFRRYLSGYQDAFRAASWGFGYTHPVKLPFLRLDRILAGQELKFVSFDMGCPELSDHYCVVAGIQRR